LSGTAEKRIFSGRAVIFAQDGQAVFIWLRILFIHKLGGFR
jgi:hypothetical protein